MLLHKLGWYVMSAKFQHTTKAYICLAQRTEVREGTQKQNCDQEWHKPHPDQQRTEVTADVIRHAFSSIYVCFKLDCETIQT